MGIPKTTENLKKFISVIFMTMYKSLGQAPEEKALICGFYKELTKSISLELMKPRLHVEDALFFPSQDALSKLMRYIYSSKISIKLCMFNIKNTIILELLNKLAGRGLFVSILTDKETYEAGESKAGRKQVSQIQHKLNNMKATIKVWRGKKNA